MKTVVLLLAIAFIATASTRVAAYEQGNIFPPKANPHGASQSEWLVRFHTWWATQPAATNPMIDTDGSFCHEGQSGPVFYIASAFLGAGTIVRNCTVPSDKTLYVPITGDICAPALDGTSTPEETRQCAEIFVDNAIAVFLTIDGKSIDFSKHRFSTGVFNILMPAGGIIGNPDPFLIADNIADGYSVMLPPQSVGPHTIHVGGQNTLTPGDYWDLTVNLTVLPAGKTK